MIRAAAIVVLVASLALVQGWYMQITHRGIDGALYMYDCFPLPPGESPHGELYVVDERDTGAAIYDCHLIEVVPPLSPAPISTPEPAHKRA